VPKRQSNPNDGHGYSGPNELEGEPRSVYVLIAEQHRKTVPPFTLVQRMEFGPTWETAGCNSQNCLVMKRQKGPDILPEARSWLSCQSAVTGRSRERRGSCVDPPDGPPPVRPALNGLIGLAAELAARGKERSDAEV